MALVIRLRQQGKTNRRSFRLVVVDSKVRRDGKYLEKLGSYDPHLEGGLEVDSARVKHWLALGAMISEKAESLVAAKAPDVMKAYKLQQQNKKLKLLQKKKASKKSAVEKSAAAKK